MEHTILAKMAIAVGLGLLIGLQREWADNRVAGIRTFSMIALLGFFAGHLSGEIGAWLVPAGMIALGAVVVSARFSPGQGESPGTTTQVAGLVVYLSTVGLALNHVTEAVMSCGCLMVLLQSKGWLHEAIRRMGQQDVQAATQLALIGLVILPVLPNQTFGPYAVINPFKIWLMVVLIVGISLGAYVLSRLVKASHGAFIAGLLGGLISSTATTVSGARKSRESEPMVRWAAAVIMVSMPVVLIRVMAEVALVAPEIVAETFPPLMAQLCLMTATVAFFFRHCGSLEEATRDPHPPSDLRTAIAFGLMYMVVLVGAAAAREKFGDQGLYAVAAISGMTDMDAITLSSAQLVKAGQLEVSKCWRAILIGATANFCFKYGVIVALGHPRLRRLTFWAFLVSFLGGLGLILYWP